MGLSDSLWAPPAQSADEDPTILITLSCSSRTACRPLHVGDREASIAGCATERGLIEFRHRQIGDLSHDHRLDRAA
jgi:hypothetical protein